MSRLQPNHPKLTDTRSAILSKAAELFSTKGYAGSSMSDLAEELGLSKAAIYHHFESKERLLRELMDSTFKELEALIIKNEGIPLDEIDVHDLLRSFTEITYSHREVIRLVLSELPAEMKAKGHKGHQYVIRLRRLLAGEKPSVERLLRAKAAIMIIATGILPLRFGKGRQNADPDVEILLAIATDALGLKKTKQR
jgi:AcrR family transcriptional regulator